MKNWKRRMAAAVAFAMTVTSLPADGLALAQEETAVVEATQEAAPETEIAEAVTEATQEQTAAETAAPETAAETAATEDAEETAAPETTAAEEAASETEETAVEETAAQDEEAGLEEELVLETVQEETDTETGDILPVADDEEEERYELYFYGVEENESIMKGYNRELSMEAYDNLEASYVEIPITGVQVSSDCVSVSYEDGYWVLNMQQACDGVTLTYTYTDPATGESVAKTVTFSITNERYSLIAVYRDNSDSMQQNETMTVTFNLYHEYYDGDNWYDEYTDNFTLQLGDYTTSLIAAAVSADGKSLDVTSGSVSGYANANVTAYVDGKKAASETVCASIADEDGYYRLLLDSELVDEDEDIKPGEELDIGSLNPVLMHYVDGSSKEETGDDYRIRLEYDADDWEVKEGTEDDAFPTLIRKSCAYTEITLTAERNVPDEDGTENWIQLCGKGYYIQVPYYDLEIAYPDSRFYTGDEIELTLQPAEWEEDELPDGCTVTWTVVDGDTDEELGEETASLSVSEDERTATLVVTPGLEETLEISVTAQVTYGGVWIGGSTLWTSVIDPICEYSFPVENGGEEDVLLGNMVTICNPTDCYIQDPEHPDGEDLEAAVTNIELSQYVVDEDGNVSAAPEDALPFSLEEGEQYSYICAQNPGYADVTLTYEDLKAGDGSTATCSFRLYAVKEEYSISVWDQYEFGKKCYRNGTTTWTTELRRSWVDDDGEYQSEYLEDYTLEIAAEEDGTPAYDTDLLTAEVVDSEAGYHTSLKLTMGEEAGDTEILVKAYVNGYTDAVCESSIDVYVLESESKSVIEPEELTDAAGNSVNPTVGEELDLSGAGVYEYTVNGQGTTKTQLTGVTWELTYDADVWDVKSGTENDAIPVLIRKSTSGTSVGLKATFDWSGDEEEIDQIDQENWYWLDELEPDGHKAEKREAVAPTCTAAGTEAYWQCTLCKKLFSDEALTNQIASPVSIAAAGHKFSDWTTVSEATVFAAETQVRTCTACGAQETQSVGSALTPTMTVPASSLKMQTKQKTTAFKITDMANGDSLVSVTSSNKKIVKVSKVNANGTFKLTAQKKAGKATLTITLASGLTKKVTVKVQKAKVTTTKISGVEKKATLKKGEKLTLSPVITPVTSQDKVTYTSSNKKVATVSSKGVVKAKKKGKATITIKSGKKTIKCKITVK